MKLKTLFLAAALAISSATVVTAPVFAAGTKLQIVALNDDQKAAVVRLNDYVNSFQSLKGKFTQTSPRGKVDTGTVMISKPGKMRFEYDNPSPLLIVADGTWLTITNKKMDRGDQFPLSVTPLRLVLAPDINLLSETNVIGFEQKDGLMAVALQDKKSKVGGFIELIFDENNNVLQQWMVVDGKGRRTTVQLTELVSGVKFNPKLFTAKISRAQTK
jgi:outer membrane lipoprotein-sorting protein